MAKQMELMLVGIRHRVTPSTIRAMAQLCPLKISLQRDPENMHDENAIAVYCREKPWKGMHIGYVPRLTASELAPRMDAGKLIFEDGYLNSVDDESGIGEMVVPFTKPSKARSRAKN